MIDIPELGEAYDGSESQLDRYIMRRKGKECDLCGDLFAEKGGPHDCGEDGQLCTPCRDIPSADGDA